MLITGQGFNQLYFRLCPTVSMRRDLGPYLRMGIWARTAAEVARVLIQAHLSIGDAQEGTLSAEVHF